MQRSASTSSGTFSSWRSGSNPKTPNRKSMGFDDLKQNYGSPMRSLNDDAVEEYPHRLSMYEIPPFEEIALEDFETFALHRLYLLKTVEMGIARNLKDQELEDWIRKAEDKYVPLHHNSHSRTLNLCGERRKDTISHFILALAFCRTDDLKKWFITQEVALFRYRFNSEMERDRLNFLNSCKFSMETCRMTEPEKEALKTLLIGATPSVSLQNWREISYFKVPFEEAADLVQRRAVYVRRGIAYIPSTEILSLIITNFRVGLETKLDQCGKLLPSLDAHDDLEGGDGQKIMPTIKNLSLMNFDSFEGLDGTTLTGTKGRNGEALVFSLKASQVDKAAATHFPPCMAHLHRKLRQESHLKHGGRMQYGLFLKSIGLGLEEALTFWRQAFSRKTGDDQFQKNYAYNIRHNYGQEGKRANYTPYSCLKIIMGHGPSNGSDHHGCPFKHFGLENLESMLINSGNGNGNGNVKRSQLTRSNLDEIKGLVQKGHFQLACTKYYEFSRGADKPRDTFVNPSEFYGASLEAEEDTETL